MSAALKREITRKLARIFECTRLLDLSRDDSEFSKGDARPEDDRAGRAEERRVGGPAAGRPRGEIIYVADTNFIQTFLQPARWRRCSRLFHDFGIWQSSERERTWEEDGASGLARAISAQAALLATEFVFSLARDSGL